MVRERRVLYRTESTVTEGDEFYQLSLREHPGAGASSFEMLVFHGTAGNPPAAPQETHTFPSEHLAREAFANMERKLQDEGFRLYNPIVHGPERDFGKPA